MKDLFEFLRVATKSDYINDMRSGINNYCARELMKTVKYENYPLSVLSDAAEYLYGKKTDFKSAEEAKKFFEMQKVNFE